MSETVAFRQALAQFATGVCLISTQCPGRGAIALTANSFASVSLDPPLILWSIQNNSECFDAFTRCERYGISILGADQQGLSNQFAQRGDHLIDPADGWHRDTGAPLLSTACAVFTLRPYAIHPAGDHHIIVGQVEHFSVGQHSRPLTFYSGKYCGLVTP